MWNWINCYLSGRHEFGVACEPGAIFLRCAHCGKRSSGWSVDGKPHVTAPRIQTPSIVPYAGAASNVVPFDRVSAR
jgi:hypothetical protein